MNLGEQFRSNVITAMPDDTLASVAQSMSRYNVGAVVVVKSAERPREIVGIVTDRDLALSLGRGDSTPETPVRQVMTTKVVTIWDDEGIFNATQYFLGHKIRRLPIVTHANELVGLVTFDDMLALLSRELFNVGRAVAPSLNNEPSLPSRESILAVP